MQTMSIWKALFTPSVPPSFCDLQDPPPEALWKQMLEAVQVRVQFAISEGSILFEELRFSSSDFNGCYDDWITGCCGMLRHWMIWEWDVSITCMLRDVMGMSGKPFGLFDFLMNWGFDSGLENQFGRKERSIFLFYLDIWHPSLELLASGGGSPRARGSFRSEGRSWQISRMRSW